MLKKLLVIGFSVLSLSLFSEDKSDLEVYKIDEDKVRLASEIIKKLETSHLVKKDYVDIKNEAFVEFLNRIDPNKAVFTSEEVGEFVQKNYLSETVAEDLTLAFNVFNYYSKRYLHPFSVIQVHA